MALNKLRQLDSDTIGVTIPKDDLRLDGLLDDAGDLEGEHHVHIDRQDSGEWELTLVEDL
ncbi:hypothetical protein L593_14410 [Salinarchaeum sp. Harcht-Bsk1]|uniref:hypothetical protein n=1 Tax=Salinarchaeum sp. Harcht-Bsk1 TaxID=1333523 RepID=UPI0003423761|nr:hypothetical protein [Salinarchaeum sp. Harcht-Bsk1]AGN02821.1 hypothetical protein L593_14410 [Salinarchaeum sp. Harcht-Bsk1]